MSSFMIERLLQKDKHQFETVENKSKEIEKQMHAKKKRILFTRLQITELERVFRKQPYLTSSERNEMAEQIKLSPTQIKIWFQNRRYKSKKLMKDYVQDAERKYLKSQKLYGYQHNVITSCHHTDFRDTVNYCYKDKYTSRASALKLAVTPSFTVLPHCRCCTR